MNIATKRTLAALTGGSIVLVGAWLSGFNFDERGPGALFVFMVTVVMAAWAAAYPGFKEQSKC